jgi:AraC family transcriptional regulator of adaptative response / DNA-3-methyladenine glycosylase II
VLDPDRCYAAVQSRDARFDGWFVTAVRTTGIYCRPSCPAITPRRGNVEFHPTAAAAQRRGFRACKRCRPDASPGSPEWNRRRDVVGRAMRLIADGVVDRDGVPGLAQRLGYGERHLHRLLTAEVGAGPLAIARAQRAHIARTLIETTDLRLVDVAFAAGFGSVRQFNDTVREVFASSPRELRAGRSGAPPEGTTVTLRLPARRPFAGAELLAFLGARAVPGVETWDGSTYRRTLDLPAGHGIATVRAASDRVDVTLRLTDWSDLAAAVQRLRRLLDLDADPVAVDAALGAGRSLGPAVAAVPGRRAAGAVDGFEAAVRAVVGQQVSIAAARTLTATIVAAAGERLRIGDPELTHLFPRPSTLATAADADLAMPSARRRAVRALADSVATDRLDLGAGADPDAARRGLVEVPGIGPWTADVAVLRGLGHPDVLPDRDLVVRRVLERLGVDPADTGRWAPWRSYATHHLWSLASGLVPASAAAPAPGGSSPAVLPSTIGAP